jgi:hypothetical protein
MKPNQLLKSPLTYLLRALLASGALLATALSANATVVNFGMGADDFGMLSINGVVLCTYDNISAAGGCNSSFDMQPGVWYDIAIDYKNRAGSDGMALSWDQPGPASIGYGFSGSFPGLVPKVNFRTHDAGGTNYVSGLRGDYYDLSGNLQSTVFGEGPIDAINDVYNNVVVGSWNGYGYFSLFEERLSGQISLGCSAALNVPYLSQGDPSWASDLYDHSSTLTIQRKGCGLTSLAMALTFAGASYNPGQLNYFMKNHDSDFDGLSVYWDPATRDASNGPLKFFGFRSSDPSRLEDALCQGHPVIVGVNIVNGIPGHFVLVTGKQGNQYLINDPGHSDRTTLDAYNNQFETRGYVADPPGDISALDVAVGDGVELLVVDPAARRTGFDAVSSMTVEEIPNSVYFKDALEDDVTGDPPTETGHICQIQRAPVGVYEVTLIGLAPRTYEVSLRAFSQDGSAQPPIVITGTAVPGVTSSLLVEYASTPGSTTGVSGSFNGGGQRPRDVNKFLTYSNPIQNQTSLPAGTTTFPLQIVYGNSIIPATFQAVLNGVNIGPSFSPAPASGQQVNLNLQSGRNVLDLSVQGHLPNRIATDNDRLVFLVP